MLDRTPKMTLADLKPGDAIIVSSTEGTAPNQITAITLVAGVEPILTAPGRKDMALGSWTLDMEGGGGTVVRSWKSIGRLRTIRQFRPRCFEVRCFKACRFKNEDDGDPLRSRGFSVHVGAVCGGDVTRANAGDSPRTGGGSLQRGRAQRLRHGQRTE